LGMPSQAAFTRAARTPYHSLSRTKRRFESTALSAAVPTFFGA
jgi:hypothetical protein